MENKEQLEKLIHLIRYYILISTTAAGSGHPTTSLSATELITTLFFKYLHYDLDTPANPANDRVIFSKGHASPLFYALYAVAGKITEEELLKMRTFESVLEGHPTPRFAYTEAATGSLGQGLAIGLGEAFAIRMNELTSQRIKGEGQNPSLVTSLPRIFVLLGDGELAEGSVWEAAMSASYNKVGNLIAVADINGLGQSRETMYGHDIEVYAKRFEAFGWRVVRVADGNDLSQVDAAWAEALTQGHTDTLTPTIIVANTKKGKGISFIEDVNGWHGKPLSKEELEKALAELGPVDKTVRGTVLKPDASVIASISSVIPAKAGIQSSKNGIPDQVGDDKMMVYDKPTATRKAFGNALVRIGKADPTMVVIDGDVGNSTYTEFFGKEFPDRFFQMFIAEQNAVGVALGMSKRGMTPWFATFAAFFTRAFDQVRMASLSAATLKLCGSHAGVSIGQDGASQMGLEDLAMFRAIHGSTVLYPSDAVSTEKLVEAMAKIPGISYIRTTRGETPIIYKPEEIFPIGGSKVHESLVAKSQSLVATIVAAGITLHEALKAQEQLGKEGVGLRVIDAYSVKPIDEKTLKQAASETKGMIVVEDHFSEGGLGEAVLSALGDLKPAKFVHLAVRKTPQSGKPAELLAYEEIDAAAILKAVKSLI